MNETTTALTVPEQQELEQLETAIEKGLETFVEVGTALTIIRDKKLYLPKYETFEKYCKDRWDIGKRRGEQLIAAARVFQNLLPLREAANNCSQETPEVEIPLPQNEAQARPLAELEPAEQREAWKDSVAASRNGTPTSEKVAEVVRKKTGRKTLVEAINELADSGRIGKQARSEVLSFDPKRQREFIKAIEGGQKAADVLRAMSREPGDEEPEPEKKPAAKPKPTPPRTALVDRAGNVVPDHLRDAFADQGLPNLIEELEQVEAMLRPESWLSRACKLCDHYGFILVDKFRENASDSLYKLQLALENLRAGVPHAVCPNCRGVDSKNNGKTCRGCRGYGLVPRHRYDELTQDKVAS